MFTRKQYMDKEVTHRQYYGQFVTDATKQRVLRCIGETRLMASTDEHLNDIPLEKWDSLGPAGSRDNWNATRGDWPSLAGAVCIHKEAAHQLIEELKARKGKS